MAKEYDIVVIGTGAAGSTVAYKCRKKGWKIAVYLYVYNSASCFGRSDRRTGED